MSDVADVGEGSSSVTDGRADQIANTYNFNNNAQMKLNETIKHALDPKGVLAPGKNGIWPKVSSVVVSSKAHANGAE